MMTEFGAEIAVDGKRPDWLKDDEQQMLRISSKGHDDWTGRAKSVAWELTRAIRLPADHPYYRATEAGYKYWPGGSMPPQDWDNSTVLLRDGRTILHNGMSWSQMDMTGDIIGYKPRPMPAAAPPPPPPGWGAVHTDGSRSGGQPPLPPTIDGLTHTDITRVLDAVRAGDLAAAQALIAPPVDPVVLRAREICRKHAPLGFDDGSAIMHVAIAALKEPLTDDQLVRIVRAVVYQARNEGGHFPAWNHSDILHGRYDKFGLFVNMLAAARDAI